ncbi:MAG: MBL fold metallo-hydrolase [Hydrogenophilales bacterium]|nr:MBL fold metallo-hydrolase [Hydrogenophilales bacterium]
MKYTVIPVTPYQQNCSLIWCEQTRQAALIDPGGDIDTLLDAIAQRQLTLTKLILTHGHVDHVGAAGILAARLGLPIEGPQRDDAFLLDGLPEQCTLFGFPHTEAFRPTRWLEDGDQIKVGETRLDVLHCPGHTPGHIVLFQAQARLAFVGDVLFKDSIGRTDFPRGNHADLIDSIRTKLWPLGDDVTFIPGHGPESSFGRERRSNPFVGDAARFR